ncbi:DDE superfamily endonuclease [Fragilaria crotonensis]|nr:DDE superfamily endonuclease [Fragilaria crotonensis]
MRSRRRRRMSRSIAILKHSLSVANVVVANAAAVIADLELRSSKTRMSNRGSSAGRTFRKRNRRSVRDVYNEIGKGYFRRAYRMNYGTFKRLASDLCPYIIAALGRTGTPRFIRNGQITPDVRLACALRWFAGGSAYDIMTTYGISHTDTMNSVWYVVDAVNRHPRFNIVYPDDHDKQRSIAQGFEKVSSAGFDCCAGAVDGILIWTHKPSPKDCMDAGCGPVKFHCGRKKKYGLNCQAVCDVRGRILDISIIYPGSSSDCLSFEGMSLFHKLEEGILAPGLCLFGDNAYLSTPYMATPYAAVLGGTKDSYNFYHSQLRIRIECTFGMLTHRWAILRSAIPMNVTIQKTVALVMALAKLHNYCIDADDGTSDLTSTANDEWHTEVNGAVPLVAPGDSRHDLIPEQLLDGGNHFDDLGGHTGRYNMQRRYNYISEQTDGVALPRDRLHSYIESIGVTRPTPLRRR